MFPIIYRLPNTDHSLLITHHSLLITKGLITKDFYARLLTLLLADITNSKKVAGVMIRGGWLSKAEIDAGLKKLEK
jgi:hypothetical protein